jgi:hypothetical protein
VAAKVVTVLNKTDLRFEMAIDAADQPIAVRSK